MIEYELRTIERVVGPEGHTGTTVAFCTNGKRIPYAGSPYYFPPGTFVLCLLDEEGEVVGAAGIKEGFSLSDPASEAVRYISDITVGKWVSPTETVRDARTLTTIKTAKR